LIDIEVQKFQQL